MNGSWNSDGSGELDRDARENAPGDGSDPRGAKAFPTLDSSQGPGVEERFGGSPGEGDRRPRVKEWALELRLALDSPRQSFIVLRRQAGDLKFAGEAGGYTGRSRTWTRSGGWASTPRWRWTPRRTRKYSYVDAHGTESSKVANEVERPRGAFGERGRLSAPSRQAGPPIAMDSSEKSPYRIPRTHPPQADDRAARGAVFGNMEEVIPAEYAGQQPDNSMGTKKGNPKSGLKLEPT